MKIPCWCLCVTFVATLARPAIAASPFEGVWHTDPASLQATVPPISLEVGGGVFTCHSCRPPYTIQADGGFYPVTGRADADASAVAIADAGHVVKTDRYRGRIILRETFAVAADGHSAQLDLTDTGIAGAAPRITRQKLTRATPGGTGISGTWRLAPDAATLSAATETLHVAGGRLDVTTPDGLANSFALDGRPSPVTGRPNVDAVSVRAVADREMDETDFLKGHPVQTSRTVVSADGRDLHIEIDDLRAGTRTVQTAHH